MASSPKLKIHTGWRLRLRQTEFALSAARYLNKNRYPLFSVRGAVFSYRIGRALKLQKLIQLNGKFFTSPILPCYPSPAFDHMVATGGLNFHVPGTPLKPQISMILLGVTRKCPLHCSHCYEYFNIGTEDVVPLRRWKEVIWEIQSQGAGVIVLSGGEPMQRYEGIIELLDSGNKEQSDFHLHTSGHGVTPGNAKELKRAGLAAAAVGLDDFEAQRHDALRGFPGAHSQAVLALRYFHSAGIFTYTNMCLTRKIISDGGLWAYFDFVKELNVGCIEMLDPKPCGGYSRFDNSVLLTSEERKKTTDFFIQGNTRWKYRRHPLIYYVAYTESPEQMGCMMGGLSHMAIDSRGNVNPCVFLPVTFGNILQEDFRDIYRRMREAIPRPIHKECPSISLAGLLKEKAAEGQGWPVPYDTIRNEWEALVKT